MPRDATLHDVAKRVGVSTRTVSRVVNDEGGFSDATRDKVLAAIEELGYRPNMLARGLITRRSGTVGLVGGDMTDPFFPAVAEGVQREARETGRTMFFASTSSDVERQGAVLDSLWSHAVDGVIVFPALDSTDQLISYARRGLNLVVVDDDVEAPNLACVSFDLGHGARLAIEHLVGSGRRRLAMLASSISPPRRRRRERGFLAAATDLGLAPCPVLRAPPTMLDGEKAMSDLIDRHPDIDAVVAYNDVVAIGACRALAKAGCTVPDDVAIVGFDDIDLSAMITPALTTVRLDANSLSREAVAAIVDLNTKGVARREPVSLPVELVVRESA